MSTRNRAGTRGGTPPTGPPILGGHDQPKAGGGRGDPRGWRLFTVIVRIPLSLLYGS
jgi:hypothetical protein